MNTNIIGNRIKGLLEQQKISQQELANKIGMSAVSISRYITGGRIPKSTVLQKIAYALDVSPDFILGKESVKKDYEEAKRLLERSVSSLSYEDKMELIRILAR